MFNNDGDVICNIENFICYRFGDAISQAEDDKHIRKLYKPEWFPMPLNPSEINTVENFQENDISTYIIVLDENHFSRLMIDKLLSLSPNCRLILAAGLNAWRNDSLVLDFKHKEKFAKVLSQSSSKKCRVLFFIGNMELEENQYQAAYNKLLEHCVSLTQIAAAFHASSFNETKFILIAQDMTSVTKDKSVKGVLASAISGLLFSIRNEFLFDTKVIDLPAYPIEEIYTAFMKEVFSSNYDADVVLTDSHRYVMQLVQQYEAIPITLKNIEKFDSNATYLITGGTSGFGLELTKWLAAKGAKRLVIVSRRGITTSYAKHTIEKLQCHGVKVVVKSMDINDALLVKELIVIANDQHKPLKGVFHCAMVLEDAVMTELNREKYDKVLSPKILGAINLHIETKNLSLDYFVMTSSIASLMGNVGQANYVAANAFLDAFVHYRIAHGFPATTLNIGALSDAGVIARSDELSKYMALLAINKTSVSATIEILDFMLANNLAHEAYFDFNWLKWEKIDKQSAHSSRFKNIITSAYNKTETETESNKLFAFLKYPKAERFQHIAIQVKQCVAAVLQDEFHKIDSRENLNNLGVDSLMVSELRQRLISEFDIEISLMELLKGVSVENISEFIVSKLNHYDSTVENTV
jgi:acyl carrier protein